MIYAGILAAGYGTRMHRQDLPKPFLTLGSKPIIIHSLEPFFINGNVDNIIVVAAEAWCTYAEDLIAKHNTFGKKTTVISGGGSKVESVAVMTEYISKNFGVGEDDILITHDAIRPFVTQRIIDENIKVATKNKAANTVMTTNDTIVSTTDGERLGEVPPKQTMFAEQTPQTFNLKSLNTMFEKALNSGVILSQEAAIARLFMKFVGDVWLVEGEYSNTKIMNPYDLEIANALLMEISK
jgi:2-C-methyl-D-erythritol 4-phosphate cytidylyltransferase